ncbi:MAG: hypothetical protein ACYDEQ_02950 [Desulfocucumaceae bacterium]
MSQEIAELIVKEFCLGQDAKNLLVKNIKTLGRDERKLYFQRIKPRETEIKNYLSGYCFVDSGRKRADLVLCTVDSMLDKKGDPDLIDGMVMDVVGRIAVYKSLRERSESEGIRLSAMTSFGGLSMVLFAVVIITALVLYVKNM